MSGRAQDDELVVGLMQEALALPAGEREAFIRASARGDTELYHEVWHYVRAEERMQGFLSRPLLERRPPPRPLEPGALLEGRFQILNLAAEGGMGLVYEALDTKLNRRIALKVAKPGFRQRLSPEVRNAQEVAHRNVCKIYEIHSMTLDGETFDFMTMEFLEGRTLAERLGDGPLPRDEARAIASQICAGLTEAHRQHVVHGDLKSSNIMLTKDVDGGLRVVITDFGMARALDPVLPAHQPDQMGGTPDYMAPELWLGEKSTTASDVYALGVLLHELIAGQRPNLTPSMRALSPAGAPPPRPIKLAPVYGPWDRTLSKCLAPSPKDRFASAVEVSASLTGWSRRRALLFAGAGAAAVASGAYVLVPGRPPTVAILPFRNASAQPGENYISDGISEGLINNLAQLAELRVVARASSFLFAGENTAIRDAAKALGATALVTGRITEAEGGILAGESPDSASASLMTIDVELVRADGTALWGAKYQAGLADLPYVQTQISGEIARHLAPQLSQSNQNRLLKLSGANPEAFAYLLRGRFEMQLYTPESTKKAADYFQQALGADAGFALANMELANTYRRLGGAGILEPAESIDRADRAIARALASDSELAEAHAVLADIRKDQWKFAEAEKEYRRAVELSPSLAAGHQGFAIFLSLLGKRTEAISELKRSADLDPISLANAVDTAAVFYNLGSFDRALETLAMALERDPSAPAIYTWIGIVRGGMGDFDKALAAFGRAGELGDKTAATNCYVVHAVAKVGRKQEALDRLNQIQRSGEFIPRSSLAIALAGLGQTDSALEVLEAGLGARDPLLQYIGVEAHLASLFPHARFRSLLNRIGLPLPATGNQKG